MFTWGKNTNVTNWGLKRGGGRLLEEFGSLWYYYCTYVGRPAYESRLGWGHHHCWMDISDFGYVIVLTEVTPPYPLVVSCSPNFAHIVHFSIDTSFVNMLDVTVNMYLHWN